MLGANAALPNEGRKLKAKELLQQEHTTSLCIGGGRGTLGVA